MGKRTLPLSGWDFVLDALAALPTSSARDVIETEFGAAMARPS